AGTLVAEIDPRDYQVAVDRARAELADAEATATAAGTGVPIAEVSTRSDVRQASGGLEEAQAGIAVADSQVEAAKAQLVAVQPGQPLMALVSLTDVWVVANFKETQLADMRDGQRVTIKVDALGGRTFNGKIDSLSAATGARFSLLPPENATGNYVKVVQRVPVKIVFEKGQDPDHLLRPGMSVFPTVIIR